MAARTRKILHDEETRAKIKTSQLINRLTKHALGDLELSTTQVRAIEVLLKKTLPDLQAVQISGDADNPIHTVTTIELVAAGQDNDEGEG